MNWTQIVGLIIQIGLPKALELIDIVKKNPEPTDEAIAKLRDLNKKTMDDYLREAKEQQP